MYNLFFLFVIYLRYHHKKNLSSYFCTIIYFVNAVLIVKLHYFMIISSAVISSFVHKLVYIYASKLEGLISRCGAAGIKQCVHLVLIDCQFAFQVWYYTNLRSYQQCRKSMPPSIVFNLFNLCYSDKWIWNPSIVFNVYFSYYK